MWFLILLAACGSDPQEATLPEPVQRAMAQALPPELREGRLAFREHCQDCHGMDARGDGPAAEALSPPDLAVSTHDRARLARIIRNGAPNTAMQPWSGKLEDEEIEAMARWIASLEAE